MGNIHVHLTFVLAILFSNHLKFLRYYKFKKSRNLLHNKIHSS